jgi:hypothetical protein
VVRERDVDDPARRAARRDQDVRGTCERSSSVSSMPSCSSASTWSVTSRSARRVSSVCSRSASGSFGLLDMKRC